MIYRVKKNLADFKFWFGAKGKADLLTYDELEKLDGRICELLGTDPTETDINNLFWFEFEKVCSLIGLDVNEVLKRDNN